MADPEKQTKDLYARAMEAYVKDGRQEDVLAVGTVALKIAFACGYTAAVQEQQEAAKQDDAGA